MGSVSNLLNVFLFSQLGLAEYNYHSAKFGIYPSFMGYRWIEKKIKMGLKIFPYTLNLKVVNSLSGLLAFYCQKVLLGFEAV
jgi:hypothetical protein